MRIFLITLLLSTQVFSQSITPTEKYMASVDFSDDLDFQNIELAISRQLKSFTGSRVKGTIRFGRDTYPKTILKDTLLAFKAHVDTYLACVKVSSKELCLETFNKALNRNFTFYRPIPKKTEEGFKTNESLFTGYYSPDLTGSRVKTDVFKHAVYGMPKEAHLKKLTREEIDFDKKLAGRGLELFYVSESLYDLWLFHVEGGGRVHVKNADGTTSFYYLSYAGTNGQKFQMLYRYMIDHGMLVAGKAGIAQQREYLANHPEVHREVFASSPSYVYFKVTQDEPLGVNNIPLTEGRSMATDYRIYTDYGLLQFVQTKKPTMESDEIVQKDFGRFFISQDTGGAIRGNARADLYFGFGHDAELAASNLKNLGTQTILIKK